MNTRPKTFVFVLMPFSIEFKDVYQLGIKGACAEAGVYCERVDEQIYDESMLDRIYNQINSSDIIVADMTGKNPNVLYEVGYAHALNKRVILLASNIDDIPFDLAHRYHIIYDSVTDLKDKLIERITWFRDSGKYEEEYHHAKNLKFYIDGEEIDDGYIFNIKCNQWDIFCNLKISYCNHYDTTYDGTGDELGIVCPDWLQNVAIEPSLSSATDSIKISEQHRLVKFSNMGVINPQSWGYVNYKAKIPPSRKGEALEMEIRHYQRSSYNKLFFYVIFEYDETDYQF